MSLKIKNKHGKNNPFYGKHHTEESKKKMGGAVHDYSGDKNPMYGRTNYDVWLDKYGKEIADEKQLSSNEKNRISNLGENNGFYGTTHTQTSVDEIIRRNKLYRETNKEQILRDNLNKLKLTDEILNETFTYYKNHICNFETLKEKFNITCDKRMLTKYWVATGIITPIELRKITKQKQFLGDPSSRTKSAIEVKIFELLSSKYGSDNVDHSYVIHPYPYVYDIILFDKLLIEYDGYYWHKIVGGKNDKIKEQLAKQHNFIIYRIEANEKEKIDISAEFDIIDKIIKENSLAPSNRK